MGDENILCIIPGPTEVLRTFAIGVKWCFKCRKHLPHTAEILGYKSPTYYDPIRVDRCSRCHGDHTLFPGREWVYADV